LSKQRFLDICKEKMRAKDMLDDKHKKRMKEELWEVEAKGEYDYFLDLYDKGAKYPANENNLMIVELLDLDESHSFNVDEEPETEMGDFPDIDIDYLRPVRDYLKNDWAPKHFGKENVCNIASYNTFGIKSSLIDMAKVHGLDRNEVLNITKSIKLKDDEGDLMTWETALQVYKPLKQYCEDHPDVAEAARRLIDRNRSRGKHAGGLIIANQRLDELIPLVIDSGGNVTSSWVEGLHAQDLGPMGLIKFDLLVISNIDKVAKITESIKERYGMESFCALPGQEDWTDKKYLNDPKAMALGSAGRMKGIFQFDSDGIRSLASFGGVKSFDDIVAYTALYRPGPLENLMHTKYCNRASGREKYEIHPVLEKILGSTYGTLVYQEQCIQIANAVGLIPLRDGYALIKAISKKKVSVFKKYRDMFIENGQKTLGWTEEAVTELWDQVESFAGYAFNKSHAVAYSDVTARLLYLKANYHLEFFNGILQCEANEDKIQNYKNDAISFGISVVGADLNKSSDVSAIVKDEDKDRIYQGISTIKGIGEVPASKIVMERDVNGLYTSLQDFMDRVGTELNLLKPLICLRMFGDTNPITLYKFYEYYKTELKKRDDRRKRFEKTQQKCKLDIADFERIGDDHEKEKVIKKMNKSKMQLENKIEKERLNPIRIEDFNPDEHDIYIEDQIMEYLTNIEKAEKAFYGFRWIPLVTLSPNYKPGNTFEKLNHEAEILGRQAVGPVEAEVISFQRVDFRSGKGFRWVAEMEDANQEKEKVTIWNDDYENWKDEFVTGKLLRVRVTSPQQGFKGYTLESYGKNAYGKSKKVDKSGDFRVVVMQPGVHKHEKIEPPPTDDEFLTMIGEDQKG